MQCKSTETCGAGLATSRKKEKKRYSYVSEVWASFSFASHMEKERLGVLILLHASQRSVDSINLLQDGTGTRSHPVTGYNPFLFSASRISSST